MFGESISILEVLKLTAMSMLVVFSCLLAISFILDLLKVLFYDRQQKQRNIKKAHQQDTLQKSQAQKLSENSTFVRSNTDIQELDEEQIMVLAFTAAIAINSGKRASNIHIHSIRKLS